MTSSNTETHIGKEWVGKVAIVTGASAGMGLNLIRVLASSGIKTIGCARNISKIEELWSSLEGKVSGEITSFKCDVSREEDVRSMFEMAHIKYGGVDILVNNAGLAHEAPLLSGATEEWKSMLDVNVLGPSLCTREYFQRHQARKADLGYVINISSIAGHVIPHSPILHFYAASKFALAALTEATRQELRDFKSNIKISQVSPGLVSTEFSGRFRKDKSKASEFYSKSLQENSCMEVGDIADSIMYLLSTPPHVCVHDIIIRPLQQRL